MSDTHAQCHNPRHVMDRHKTLESLLLSMFAADELRRILRHMPDGDAVVDALPNVNASAVSVVSEAVAILARTGHLREPAFWQRLCDERPRRIDEIGRVRAIFQTGDGPATPAAPTAAVSRVVTILLVSASPDHKKRLRVDKEFRDIVDRLRSSRFRDNLRLIQVTAARFEDLRRALLEHEPHILHLSAHGEADGTLVFEARDDGNNAVTSKQVRRLVGAIGRGLRLAVLNVCHSAVLARDLAPDGGCSIGMREEIVDGEAIEFSVALYEALAFGRSVETAFEVAVSGLSAEDDDAPQLYPEPGRDGSARRGQPLIVGDAA